MSEKTGRLSAAQTKRPPRRANQGAKPRSRAGCITCKSKHVKCDETWPDCRTCTRKGLVCGGYSRALKWSYKHQPMTIQSFSCHQYGDIVANTRRPDPTTVTSSDSEPPQLDPDSPSNALPQSNCDKNKSDESFSKLLEACHARQDLSDGQEVFGPPLDWDSIMSPELDALEPDTPSSSLDPERYLLRASSLTSGPDTTVALMASWFDKVCPAWSAFDSMRNLNRKLAEDLWHSSAAVFNSLQSMSASFLSARLPHMRPFALSLMKTATLCTQAEVAVIRRQAQMESVPTGLLFSLFCLGTTVCWLDASRLGRPFLNEAKYILRRLGQQYTATCSEEREVLLFFKKSLVYWEMLLAVADETPEGMSDIATGQEVWLLGNEEDDGTVDNLPHPWTGISTLTSHLFARSIKLCRAYRYDSMGQSVGAGDLAMSMDYFKEAQKLEEQLLELEFSSFNPTNDTGDDRTPLFHLARVAEAYQLSSLLQLYESFPGLVSLRLPLDSILSEDGQVPWERWIVPLSLRLTEVLEHIPPDSGSRVIQPLLYICAGTGLRFSLLDSPSMLSARFDQGRLGATMPSGSNSDDSDLLEYIGQIDTTDASDADASPVSQTTLDICKAREFVMSRLDMLERSLQPKPVIVAKELVKAVWVAYDSEIPGSAPVHWLDVMENQALRSLFG